MSIDRSFFSNVYLIQIHSNQNRSNKLRVIHHTPASGTDMLSTNTNTKSSSRSRLSPRTGDDHPSCVCFADESRFAGESHLPSQKRNETRSTTQLSWKISPSRRRQPRAGSLSWRSSRSSLTWFKSMRCDRRQPRAHTRLKRAQEPDGPVCYMRLQWITVLDSSLDRKPSLPDGTSFGFCKTDHFEVFFC